MIARRAAQQAYERDLALAWHIANWSGPGKKLPELKTVLQRVRPLTATEKQNQAQLRTSLEMLSERIGIPLRRMRLVKKESA